MKKLFVKNYIRYSIILIGGIFLGWLFFHTHNDKAEKLQSAAGYPQGTIWTCAMHPQIRMNAPGKCPICGMELIPVGQNNKETNQAAIHMTKEAAELANVLTSMVSRQSPVKEVRLYGKVQADERLLQSQVAYFPGRIDNLFINYTGETVKKGQKLAVIYSPALITAQQELLETAKTKSSQPELYEAAKDKLRQWKLSDNQITDIEKSGTVKSDFEVYATTSGIVTAKRVNNGDFVSSGTVLFDVADLSAIWILFDAYESDLPFLAVGNSVSYTLQAIPGATFHDKISFVDPVLDPVTRVAKVRVEVNNETGKLKPEMFVTGLVEADLREYSDKMIIPSTAVLWTGKRSVVYVKQSGTAEPVFKMREIETGPMLGNSYVVMSGLNEGEQIVTQGAFSVDAAAQLEGKPSMMSPAGGEKVSSMPGMDMGGMDMPGNKMPANENIKQQLTSVYKAYLTMKDAFVASDAQKIADAAKKVRLSIKNADTSLSEGDDHEKWMKDSGDLEKILDKIISSSDLNDQRESFAVFNLIFHKTIESFGLAGTTTYYQYCPMANGNKGAYWFSEKNEIANPYFGKEMLNCGETKEVLNF